MKNLFLSLSICLTAILSAQSTFQKGFWQPAALTSNIVYANEYNTSTLLVGNYTDTVMYSNYAAITKFTTSTGNITSTKKIFSGTNTVDIESVTKKNASLYVAATVSDFTTVSDYVFKYNLSTNSITWCKQINIAEDFSIKSITHDNAKNLYILGSIYDTINGDGNLLIAKIDTLGNFIWSKSFGETGRGEDAGQIIFNGNREIYVSGLSFTRSIYSKQFITRFDSAGNVLNTLAELTGGSGAPRFSDNYLTVVNNKVAFVTTTTVGSGDPGPTLIRILDSSLVVLNTKITDGLKVKQIYGNQTHLLLTGQAPVTSGYPGFRSIRYDATLNAVGSKYFQKINTYSIASSAVAFINSNNQSIHAFKPGGSDSLFVIKTDAYENTNCNDTAFVPVNALFSYTTSSSQYSVYTPSVNLVTKQLSLANITTTVNSLCIGTGVSTSVNESATNSGITFFPNPTQSILHIQADNFIISKVILVDVLGKEQLVSLNSNTINLSNLPQGIYFAIVFDSNNRKQVIQKIIKE